MSTVTVQELDKLVTEIFKLKEEYDAISEGLNELGKELKAKEAKCTDYLKELQLKTFSGQMGKVTPYDKTSYTTPKTPEARAEFFSHLQKEGLFDNMVTVNYQTLNSYASEFYEAAKVRGDLFAVIPGLGAPNIVTILSKTRSKK